MTAKLKSDRADRLVDRAKNACYLRLGRWTPIELAAAEPAEIARDEAEGVRVAYVAATRARDLLVVPAVGDAEWDGGWMSPLNAAIYPPPDRRRSPETATGCPPFKKDSVWRRPDNDPSTPQTVCPGQYTFEATVRLKPDTTRSDDPLGATRPKGGDAPYEVIWWDPHALDLEVEPPPGIRREALIVKDVPESVLREGLQEYQTWRARLETTITAGSTPSVSVRTATEWAAGNDRCRCLAARSTVARRRSGSRGCSTNRDGSAARAAVRAAIEIVDAHRGDRPGGARFGELVHAVLASTALDADRNAVQALAEVQARILSAPADEMATRRTRHARAVARVARARPCRGRARVVPPRDAADALARRRQPGRRRRRPRIRGKRGVDHH